jgi:hypothetical protein
MKRHERTHIWRELFLEIAALTKGQEVVVTPQALKNDFAVRSSNRFALETRTYLEGLWRMHLPDGSSYSVTVHREGGVTIGRAE